MEPPWSIEPDIWQSKFWVVLKTPYLDAWRKWFTSLSDEQQIQYKTSNPPPAPCESFYSVFAKPPFDSQKFADQFRDPEGKLSPPWFAFPHIGLGSIGWRMGAGEDYWIEFDRWYKSLTSAERVAYRDQYPEPTKVEQGLPWTGFYDRKEKN